MKISSRLTLLPALFVGLGTLPPAAVTAQDSEAVIEYRKSMMQGLRTATGAMRSIREGTLPYTDHLMAHAMSVQNIADGLSDVFPAGSGEGETRALAAIWDDPGGFGEAVQAIQSAARALVAAARSGDEAAIDEARGSVGQTCQGCHSTYRARPQRRGGPGR